MKLIKSTAVEKVFEIPMKFFSDNNLTPTHVHPEEIIIKLINKAQTELKSNFFEKSDGYSVQLLMADSETAHFVITEKVSESYSVDAFRTLLGYTTYLLAFKSLDNLIWGCTEIERQLQRLEKRYHRISEVISEAYTYKDKYYLILWQVSLPADDKTSLLALMSEFCDELVVATTKNTAVIMEYGDKIASHPACKKLFNLR